jgi:UDP-N-acetylmuramoylalanine--D-glutamate ligase
MLRAAGLRAAAAGNVGRPALSLPGQPLDAAVLEVSSFQLESTDAFAPRVAVVLNLTPDHLDRHGDMHGYAEAKRRILCAQGPDDCAVLNFDDPLVRGFSESARGAVVPFSMREPPGGGPWERSAWLDTGAIVLRDSSGLTRLPLDSLRLTGRHNMENVLASISAVWAFGADPVRALDALIDFRGLAHRSEVVGHLNGVTFVNDSKATNPGAAIRSLEGFGQRIVWIAGGRDKGLAFDALAEVAGDRVRAALLIGESAGLLEDALAGHVLCEQQPSLRVAVRRAAELAEPGDIVLLAPACASFDQFESFEARGDHFRELVSALERRKTR